MKKLILFTLAILFLASCRDTDFKSTMVDNPTKATTVNIQSTLDTAIIKIDAESHKLYIVENNLVVREFKWHNNDQVAVPAGLILFLLLAFLIIILMGILMD